jgi:predicted nucleic acid-binding protein
MPASPPPKNDVFFDTNILLYLNDDDSAKADVAQALLSDGGVVNAHVLGEVTNTMRGKRWNRTWEQVHAQLAVIRANTVVLPITVDTHGRGLAYAERYKLRYFDALHVASAVLANCKTLWTEDMHSGLMVDGLTVRNPFRA